MNLSFDLDSANRGSRKPRSRSSSGCDLECREELFEQSIQDLLIATIQNLRKLIGAIQNVPQSAWKPLIRTLSWLCVMQSALFTPDPPGRARFNTDLTCRPLQFRKLADAAVRATSRCVVTP
jgi:hypothetical protein